MAEKDIAKIVISLMVGFVMGLLLGCILVSATYQDDAIKANCGHYNSISGAFEWGPSPIAEKKDDNNL